MAIKPILFNTPMTKSILDECKTCTRRLLKQPFTVHPNGYITKPRGNENLCPYEPPYMPGDILYVREAWYRDENRYMYRADYSGTEKFYNGTEEVKIKWRPSIHMPKKAARIWLMVTDVKVERLHDMWASDVTKEGIRFNKPATSDEMIQAFADLWDSTVNKSELNTYGWNANPYVWVIGFKKWHNPETKLWKGEE